MSSDGAMVGPRRTSLLPAQSFVMSDRQLGFRSAPGAQLLCLGLFGVFEIIMGLHEEEPRTLPIADRMRLLQARLRLPSPHIDASHEPTPPVTRSGIAALNRGKMSEGAAREAAKF